MIWLTWRQHHIVALIAGAFLGIASIVLIVVGRNLYHDVQSLATAACRYPACAYVRADLSQQSVVLHGIGLIMLGVPVLIGLFVGVPLVTREFEQQTYQTVWMQSVPRHRWLATQVGLVMLSTLVLVGVTTALLSWGENAINIDRFSRSGFDLSGIVPLAYAAFALALGVATGALVRRTLPAIAIVFVGFVGLRFVIANVLRPHFQPPVLALGDAAGDVSSWTRFPGPRDWQIEQGFIHAGQRYPGGFRIPLECISNTTGDTIFPCMQAHGWSSYILYQPAARFWQLQGIEAAIFALLAIALVALTFVLVEQWIS